VTSSIGWIVAFAVAGMLFVVPTAGEVQIIQAMLALGMGVGPAGALLMTLPPVSVPSFAMLAGSFRPRVLVAVGAVVVLFGVLAGLATVALGFNEPPLISPVSPSRIRQPHRLRPSPIAKPNAVRC
jgi:uncharacterized membrane protein YraQ (UPF0718 family)